MEAARQIFPEFQELVLDFPARRAASKPAVRPRFAFNKIFIMLALLALACFAHMSLRMLIAQNGIDIDRLRTQIKAEERAGQMLSARATSMKSPARIERLALRLKMVKPDGVTFIEVPAGPVGDASSDVGPARPATSLSRPAVLGRLVAKMSFLVN